MFFYFKFSKFGKENVEIMHIKYCMLYEFQWERKATGTVKIICSVLGNGSVDNYS